MILPLITAAAFACQVVKVYDGDSLTCADRTKVRLAAIDAPELNGTCHGKRGRVCTPGDGKQSRDTLGRLAMGRMLQCEKVGVSYRRTVARCLVGGLDISCEMVARGQAVERYGKLRGCR